MSNRISEFGDLIRRKKLFPLAKHLLNFLFVVSISSFLFEKFYYKYQLLDVTDYKTIYAFLVKGDFAIPLTIFFIVWVLTFSISTYAFVFANMALSKFFRKKMNKLEIDLKKQSDDVEKAAEITHGISFKEKYGKDWFEFLIEKIRASYTTNDLQSLLAYMSKIKSEKEDEFVILFRGLIAVSIYVTITPHFGKWLYIILLIAFLIYVFVIVSTYQLMELTPDVIIKIKKHFRKNESSQENKKE
jgi:ABC-type multidrug transport system fused ATPase/permease subunit